MSNELEEKKAVLLAIKAKLNKSFFTFFPFILIGLVAVIGWFDQVKGSLTFLKVKISESFYALAPFVILAAITYFIFQFAGSRLTKYRKELFCSLGKSFAIVFILIGFNRALIYWNVDNRTLVNADESLYLFLPFLLGSIIAKYLINKISAMQSPSKKGLVETIASSVSIIIFVVGVLSSMSKMGYDITVLIGSLGLGSLAFGLAVKDSVSNSICGLLIILYEPFKVGSFITIAGMTGHVEKIELKYVTLRQDDDTIHILPNITVFSEVISVKKKKK